MRSMLPTYALEVDDKAQVTGVLSARVMSIENCHYSDTHA
jgi:hypothetical protein